MKCAIKDCENQVSLLCLSCHALISGEGLPSQAYHNSRRMIETALIKQQEQEPVKLSWADIGVTSLPLPPIEKEPVAWVQPNGEIVVRTDYGGRLYYSEQNVYTAQKVAQWMIERSYATGHGDTIEDLLAELEWQVAEQEREACAKVCDDWSEAAGVHLAATIRARGEK